MFLCCGAGMRARLFAVLLCCLAVELAFATLVRSAEYSSRVMALTCCERVETAWTILWSWSRTCADERARRDATAKAFTNMLAAQSRSSIPALPVQKVCRGTHLTREAIRAFFEHALCASLPLTHTDLVRSAYSSLMEDSPHDEDALTSGVAVACYNVQQVSSLKVVEWEELLSGGSDLADAQSLLCPRPCMWVVDTIAGGAYRL
ncbi:hypothetical protein JKF63_03454 [Porcisia hertigi]|uniref:Uncharacterized protein n=1 Tax=Porcisia hertigi TaxID=2761500 RepID=A0A836L819_9TRYP|nr:hypothetical protein JKF63_03454 [Porcisia hertigi]